MIARRLGLAILLSLLLAPGLTLAEPGRIEGRIANEDKGIGGVTVEVFQTDDEVISDRDGKFAIESLEPGSYTLLLTFGVKQQARIVRVEDGQTASVDLNVDWAVQGYEKVKVLAGVERVGKIVDAPGAITEVASEEIEREASHGQLPKVLEYTPGAEVTQSGLYDFNFNTRGFNSSLNRRVSTYIDGRDVGVPLLGAQEWAALSVPLDDLAGLEFIRGPSAALYGANASSGVVRMTTKAPRDSLGGTFRAVVGEVETVSMDFRWADEIGSGWYYKLVAGTRDTGDFTVSRDPCPGGPAGCQGQLDNLPPPEYSTYCDRVGETDCLPQERLLDPENDVDIRFGGLRLDKYLSDDSVITIEGGMTDLTGPAFQTGIGRVQVKDAKRPWGRIAYSRPHFSVLGHYANRNAHQVNLTKGLRADFDLYSDTVRYGVEFQTDWSFAANRVRFIIGGAHTAEEIDSTDPDTGKQTIVYAPLETERQAIFSQVDVQAHRKVKLVFAGRVDWNTLHDTQFSPKVALVYSIDSKNSLRFTYNEAFQVANYSEFFLSTRLTTFPLLGFAQTICRQAMILQLPISSFDGSCLEIFDNAPVLAVGNDDLELETTQAIEFGYSGVLGKRAFVTVDYYRSRNENFITDLLPQLGTSLGSPLNPDYLDWRGPIVLDDQGVPWDTEEVVMFQSVNGPITMAQALRNTVSQSVGRLPLGFQLAQNLDGSTVLVGRTYGNIGEVDTQGIDLGFQFFFNEAWKMQLSYSWFDFEILDEAPDAQNLLVPNTPEHKGSLGFSYSKPKWNVGLAGRWVEGFRWSTGVFQGDVPAYTTVDLTAGGVVHKHLALGLNVANFMNNTHRQTFGGDLLTRRALLSATVNW